MYPAYVPGVLYALVKKAPFAGQGYKLQHPVLNFYLGRVEGALHETLHAVLLWRDDEFEWRDKTADVSMLYATEIRSELAQRNDGPRQECITLAAEYWILKHWGFSGTGDWLQEVADRQPMAVTVRRTMHHLNHPVKRRFTLDMAHRAMKLIRQSVQNWRNDERRANQAA